MNRTVPIVALGLGLLCADLSAQGRNFAGSWTLDAERTMAANAGAAGPRGGAGGGFRSGGGGGGAVVPQGGAVARGGGGGGMRSGGPAGPMTIALEADTFSVSSGTNVTTYRLDGSPTTTETPGGQITAKASWKGDRIVIETTGPGPNGPIATTATWYIEGESLVRETSLPGPDGELMTRKTYYKRA
jgi:hypothetical protein